MKTIILALVFGCASAASFACEPDFDPTCGHPLSATTVGATVVTFSPTVALGASSALATGSLNKSEFIRNAAVDAAQYLQDGTVGASLQIVFDTNPNMDREQAVDDVLEAAQQL